MQVIKPLSNMIPLNPTTGNTVVNGKLIFLSSNTNSRHIITVANTTGNNYSLLMANGVPMYIEKSDTDLLFANSTNEVFATKIAFRG
jgi:hypothetical protein